jgi:hypothetical protein
MNRAGVPHGTSQAVSPDGTIRLREESGRRKSAPPRRRRGAVIQQMNGQTAARRHKPLGCETWVKGNGGCRKARLGS